MSCYAGHWYNAVKKRNSGVSRESGELTKLNNNPVAGIERPRLYDTVIVS